MLGAEFRVELKTRRTGNDSGVLIRLAVPGSLMEVMLSANVLSARSKRNRILHIPT